MGTFQLLVPTSNPDQNTHDVIRAPTCVVPAWFRHLRGAKPDPCITSLITGLLPTLFIH
jgi:hypothetical protein